MSYSITEAELVEVEPDPEVDDVTEVRPSIAQVDVVAVDMPGQ